MLTFKIIHYGMEFLLVWGFKLSRRYGIRILDLGCCRVSFRHREVTSHCMFLSQSMNTDIRPSFVRGNTLDTRLEVACPPQAVEGKPLNVWNLGL